VRSVLAETASYYLLQYRPAYLDAELRAVKVAVPGKDVTVRARSLRY
jgi:hypothetical protein